MKMAMAIRPLVYNVDMNWEKTFSSTDVDVELLIVATPPAVNSASTSTSLCHFRGAHGVPIPCYNSVAHTDTRQSLPLWRLLRVRGCALSGARVRRSDNYEHFCSDHVVRS